MKNEFKKTKGKNTKAKEVAKSMVENMTKNMNDPNFYNDHERMQDEVASKVIKKREQRRKNQET
jgi:hypothetical protein